MRGGPSQDGPPFPCESPPARFRCPHVQPDDPRPGRRLYGGAVRRGLAPGAAGRAGRGLGPSVYALSLAIYCTSWTFFGSVGLASTRGLDFLPIYLGPILVFALGYHLLLRMVLAGTGIGAVPDVFAQADVRRNALVRILPDWCFPRMPISAVFPGRKLMPPKTRVFIEMLHAALGDPHAV